MLQSNIMFGIILSGISAFFAEIASSIGKRKVEKHEISVYTMAFLNMFWGALVFFLIAIFIRKNFQFSIESLPTFSIRAILELAQMHFSYFALAVADRSAFGFVRTGTIPLLLIIDIVLGYAITIFHIIGIFIIAIGFMILFLNHGIRKKGLGFIIFTTINAAVTISLFKYNITNFNSVEAEQGLITVILMIYFFIMAYYTAKENPLSFFKKPIFLTQSVVSGISSVISSFAYIFAPSSIITAARRSFDVLLSIVCGNVYFNEKHLGIKIFAMFFVVSGIIVLALYS